MASTYQKTKHVPWIDYKTIAVTGSALGNDEKKPGNIPSDAYKIPEGMNHLEMRVSADDNTASGTMHVYAARRGKDHGTYDDVALLGSNALTVGEQVTSNDWYYVDTMVLTDRWITEISLADNNGNNGMSRLTFDVFGYDCIFVIIDYTGSVNWNIEVSGF